MPFRKKILYYGLLLLLTLLALEGMARIAYYAAYGQGYGGGRPAALADSPAPPISPEPFEPWLISHPFYGFTHQYPYHALNATPPRLRRADTAVIGLLGGSVAERIEPFLQSALNRWFAANAPARRPLVLGLANRGAKQPQQTLIVANTLLQGGEFDLIVNLDGFNEIISSIDGTAIFPFFPKWWDKRVGLTGQEVLQTGRLGVLRREQARLAMAGETSILRWSALFGLANRYRQESVAAEIIQLNHDLAAAAAATYNFERQGPKTRQEIAELRPAAARFWYRSSLMLARLAELGGADYYHFLQPNQYVPNSKPLSPQERELAYAPQEGFLPLVTQGYPLLTAFNPDLPRQGVNYFDLTGIFADHPETLYGDPCCHLNDRGNELLAAEMVRRLEPALRRLTGASPARPDSPLAAARRPAESTPPLAPLAFQVYLRAEGNYLEYVRENCDPEDTEPRFFVDWMPQDLTDLPPRLWERGYETRLFSFAEAGGRFSPERCTMQIPLPDYPLAHIITGQYLPLSGQLWNTAVPVPE